MNKTHHFIGSGDEMMTTNEEISWELYVKLGNL